MENKFEKALQVLAPFARSRTTLTWPKRTQDLNLLASAQTLLPNTTTFQNCHICNYTNHAWLRERAILATKNVYVDAINFKIQQSLPSNEIIFKSINIFADPNKVVNYLVAFKCATFPCNLRLVHL